MRSSMIAAIFWILWLAAIVLTFIFVTNIFISALTPALVLGGMDSMGGYLQDLCPRCGIPLDDRDLEREARRHERCIAEEPDLWIGDLAGYAKPSEERRQQRQGSRDR